jgi:hypothetical protein
VVDSIECFFQSGGVRRVERRCEESGGFPNYGSENRGGVFSPVGLEGWNWGEGVSSPVKI